MYFVIVMTTVIALEAGQSIHGTFEPIASVSHITPYSPDVHVVLSLCVSQKEALDTEMYGRNQTACLEIHRIHLEMYAFCGIIHKYQYHNYKDGYWYLANCCICHYTEKDRRMMLKA